MLWPSGLFLLLLSKLLLGHSDEPVEAQGGEDVEDDEGPEDAVSSIVSNRV